MSAQKQSIATSVGAESIQEQIVISPQEIQHRVGERSIEFESDSDRKKFNNELFNSETISSFI